MMKTKSIWIIRKIFSRLNSLHLQKYYFECGIIFLNVMLRSSILYACESYYALKETELRQLERIEENFLRQLFKTSAGCPISQLYLESGHTPARFAIQRSRLLFLKTILNEKPESKIYQFLQLQFQNPTRGDWGSTCIKDLEYLEIKMSLDEIKAVTVNKFKGMLNKSIEQRALQYLRDKRGSKGIEMNYLKIEMAEYLMPNDEQLSIEGQRYIFAIRNRMVNVPVNFPKNQSEVKCACGVKEDMQHIYLCEYWNKQIEPKEYTYIFSDKVKEQVEVYKRFKANIEIREKYLSENDHKNETDSHAISQIDPLSSVYEYSNGNK